MCWNMWAQRCYQLRIGRGISPPTRKMLRWSLMLKNCTSQNIAPWCSVKQLRFADFDDRYINENRYNWLIHHPYIYECIHIYIHIYIYTYIYIYIYIYIYMYVYIHVGFHSHGGYPDSSSILDWDFPWRKPSSELGVPPWLFGNGSDEPWWTSEGEPWGPHSLPIHVCTYMYICIYIYIVIGKVPNLETHEVFVVQWPWGPFFFAPKVPKRGFHRWGYRHGKCPGFVRGCCSRFHHSEFQIAECAVESHGDGWGRCRDWFYWFSIRMYFWNGGFHKWGYP